VEEEPVVPAKVDSATTMDESPEADEEVKEEETGTKSRNEIRSQRTNQCKK
jgi:hypothetical protein